MNLLSRYGLRRFIRESVMATGSQAAVFTLLNSVYILHTKNRMTVVL